MPRLSIVIPHRHNDQRLEATLLSVLENRPHDSEVILIHDGSYADPYNLGDEVVFVVDEPSCSLAQMLNAGMMAACAPNVAVVLDGTLVSPGWSEEALNTLSDPAWAATSLCVRTERSRSLGIDSQADASKLLAGKVFVRRNSQSANISAPVLACGFYRRKALLALGGWNEFIAEETLDVEMSFAMCAAGFACASSEVEVENLVVQNRSAAATANLASLSIASSGDLPTLPVTLGLLVTECLKGRPLRAMAWLRGLRDTKTIRRIRARLAHAREQSAVQQGTHFSDPENVRRRAA